MADLAEDNDDDHFPFGAASSFADYDDDDEDYYVDPREMKFDPSALIKLEVNSDSNISSNSSEGEDDNDREKKLPPPPRQQLRRSARSVKKVEVEKDSSLSAEESDGESNKRKRTSAKKGSPTKTKPRTARQNTKQEKENRSTASSSSSKKKTGSKSKSKAKTKTKSSDNGSREENEDEEEKKLRKIQAKREKDRLRLQNQLKNMSEEELKAYKQRKSDMARELRESRRKMEENGEVYTPKRKTMSEEERIKAKNERNRLRLQERLRNMSEEELKAYRQNKYEKEKQLRELRRKTEKEYRDGGNVPPPTAIPRRRGRPRTMTLEERRELMKERSRLWNQNKKERMTAEERQADSKAKELKRKARENEMDEEELEARKNWKNESRKLQREAKREGREISKEELKERKEQIFRETRELRESMTEEEWRAHLELRKEKAKAKRDPNKKKKKTSRKEKSSRTEEEKRQERNQRRILSRIEKIANMTEEEKVELRQKNYIRYLNRKANGRSQYQTRQNYLKKLKIEDPAKYEAARKKRNEDAKQLYQRKYAKHHSKPKQEVPLSSKQKYQEFIQKRERRNELRIQELMSQGMSAEDAKASVIPVLYRSEEHRRKRLIILRISAAKRKLRLQLESCGTPEEVILQRLQELKDNYVPTSEIKPYRPYKYKDDAAAASGAESIPTATAPSTSTATRFPSHFLAIPPHPPLPVKNEEGRARAPSEISSYSSSTRVNPEESVYTPSGGDVSIGGASVASSPGPAYNDDGDGGFDDDDDHDDYHEGYQDLLPMPPSYLPNPTSQLPHSIPQQQQPQHQTWTINLQQQQQNYSNFNQFLPPPPPAEPFSGFTKPSYQSGSNDLASSAAALPRGRGKRGGSPSNANANSKSHRKSNEDNPIQNEFKSKAIPTSDGKKVICKDCGKTYFKGSFLSHYKKTHNPNYVDGHCILCNIRFTQKQFLKHYNNVHLNRRRNTKKDAELELKGEDPAEAKPDVSFSGNRRGRGRRATIDPENTIFCPFQCYQCGDTFKTEVTLNKHIYFQHGEGSLKENFLQCHLCNQRCKSKSLLQGHISRMHPSSSTSNGRTKPARAPPNQCKVCLETIPPNKMDAHIKDKHPEQYLPCRFCGSLNLSNVAKTFHEAICKTATKEQRDDLRKEMEEKGEPGSVSFHKVQCGLCETKCTLKSLERHYQDKHKKKENKKSKCEVCGMEFMARPNFVVHLSIHRIGVEEAIEKCREVRLEGEGGIQEEGGYGRRRAIEKIKVNCELCNYEVVLKCLKGHYEGFHKIKEDGGFPCLMSQCTKPLHVTREGFMYHMETTHEWTEEDALNACKLLSVRDRGSILEKIEEEKLRQPSYGFGKKRTGGNAKPKKKKEGPKKKPGRKKKVKIEEEEEEEEAEEKLEEMEEEEEDAEVSSTKSSSDSEKESKVVPPKTKIQIQTRPIRKSATKAKGNIQRFKRKLSKREESEEDSDSVSSSSSLSDEEEEFSSKKKKAKAEGKPNKPPAKGKRKYTRKVTTAETISKKNVAKKRKTKKEEDDEAAIVKEEPLSPPPFPEPSSPEEEPSEMDALDKVVPKWEV